MKHMSKYKKVRNVMYLALMSPYCSRSSRSPRGNYLFEKVERVSYIRTWFDRSADQKCWFPAPKNAIFNDLWTKEVIHCLKKKWTQSADDLLGFCERLWNEFKRFGQPDHFWLQQNCKNNFPEA